MLQQHLKFDNNGDILVSSIIERHNELKSYNDFELLTKREKKEFKAITYIISILYTGQIVISQHYFNCTLNDTFLYAKHERKQAKIIIEENLDNYLTNFK